MFMIAHTLGWFGGVYLCVRDITAVEFFNWALAHSSYKYGKLSTRTTVNNWNENSRLKIALFVKIVR